MRRVAAKVDLNHAEIRDGLRQLGFSVADTARLGQGFPDLVVAGRKWTLGSANEDKVATLLVEVKRDNKAGLTPDEKEFFATWQGAVMVATCIEDILVWYGRV